MHNVVYRDPIGVVGAITPWNCPFYLSLRVVAPAIATGNSIVLKPDDQTRISGGLVIAKLFEDAGLPKGI
ncbi:aldehyde dehydrogenase family protein [Alkalihalobacterium alkalinitrilicum]|uniref:aldehyde dehydrogenase family protein n=1 Tax=Alkalihalobacterium alkalinitrilicum TaxID=427920 RepID=UPI0013031385|nr:aldehyde dehydrogenase family protein [Alkalihalobacterium alkalinitrilicum]